MRVSTEFSSDKNLDRLVRGFSKLSRNVEPQLCADPISSRYFLVTACRDEAQYARRCLNSILNQSVRPDLWVIVDDGSSDETPSILAEFAEKHSWIIILRREDRGRRAVGPGVVDAFYAGMNSVRLEDYEFLCKCDLDLDLPPRYFEILIRRMLENPNIGTCSGKAYFERNGRYISEKCGDEMSVGMTKFYRVSCFKEIGGFVREVMWDGIDCHRCRMLGWIACSWDEPELRFLHLRPMGSSQKGILTGRIRHGFGQYFMGTGFLYMTVSAIFRFAHPPFILGGLAMWWGYVRSILERKPRYDDLEFRHFLRRYQIRCLLSGKKTATEMVHSGARESFQKQDLLPSCE
jgi:glycosyltransferase involved in cell wall biosynthesis